MTQTVAGANMQTLTTRDIQLQNTKFTNALHQAQVLQDELSRFWGQVESEMVKHDIQSIKGSWGYLTLATKKKWKADKLPPRFYKQTLNTTKLNYLYKAGEKLPKGATFSETTYLTKKVN